MEAYDWRFGSESKKRTLAMAQSPHPTHRRAPHRVQNSRSSGVVDPHRGQKMRLCPRTSVGGGGGGSSGSGRTHGPGSALNVHGVGGVSPGMGVLMSVFVKSCCMGSPCVG